MKIVTRCLGAVAVVVAFAAAAAAAAAAVAATVAVEEAIGTMHYERQQGSANMPQEVASEASEARSWWAMSGTT